MQFLKSTLYNVLRKHEHLFKTDMVYVAKNGFWVFFGQISSSVLSLVLVIIFANLVNKETYGLYRYILSIAGILNIFTLTGMNEAVTQAVAAGKEYAFKASIIYQLKWNLLMFGAALVLGSYYLLNGNPTLAISIWVMGIFSPLTATLNTYNSYLAGKKKFKVVNLCGFVSTLIYVVGMITAIYLSGDLVVWLIVAYSLTTFISNLIFYVAVTRIYRPPSAVSGPKSEIKEVINYGRNLTFIGYLGKIVAQIDSIVLVHFWGASSLAVYSLANAMPNRATGMLKDYTSLGFPKFASKTATEINSIFRRRIIQGLVIGAICTLAYVVLSPFLFKYLIPKYIDGLFYSQLLAISIIFALPNRYVGLILTAQKLTKSIFVSSLVQNTTQILLYIVLGIWGGILGLIIAKVSFSFVSFLINIMVWKISTSE
ncbi:MAG: oligosaccharide flippase family protein [Candidatus Vogelbacteria bacterium]|nr:oligosaccharide flippase family protein [Candidatus Vogelbacteria bacterium]